MKVDKKLLKAMYRRGVPVDSIAEHFGITKSYVYILASNLKVKRKKRVKPIGKVKCRICGNRFMWLKGGICRTCRILSPKNWEFITKDGLVFPNWRVILNARTSWGRVVIWEKKTGVYESEKYKVHIINISKKKEEWHGFSNIEQVLKFIRKIIPELETELERAFWSPSI